MTQRLGNMSGAGARSAEVINGLNQEALGVGRHGERELITIYLHTDDTLGQTTGLLRLIVRDTEIIKA